MRTKISLAVAAGAAALTLSAPAFAQTSEDPGFSGVYVGGSFGYDIQPNDRGSTILFDRNLDGRFNDNVLTATGGNAFQPGFCNGRALSANAPGQATAGQGCRPDKDGKAYYARVGFDQQYGRVVVGVVGEFGKTDITDSVSAYSSTPAAYVMTRSIDWEAGIRGRIGYTPNNTTLFYGAFGPGYAKIDHDFYSTQSVNQFSSRGKNTKFGYQAGGGVEQKLGKNFSIGLEYLYHDYNDDNNRVRATSAAGVVTPFTNPTNGGTASGTDFRRSDQQFRWHSLRATAAFRF